MKQIKFLVSPEKANNGRFVVMSEMVLLSDVSTSIVIHATEKISRTKILLERYVSQIYRKEFETKLIESTEKYCTFLSSEWISHGDVTSYLRKFVRLYADETARVKSYLHETTLKRLQKCVVECMLIGHRIDSGSSIHDTISRSRKSKNDDDDVVEQLDKLDLESDVKEEERKTTEDNTLYVRLLQSHEHGLFSALTHRKFEEVGRFYDSFFISYSFGFTEALKLAAEIFGQFVLAEGEHIAETRANMLQSLQKKFRKARKTYVSPCTAHEYVVFEREAREFQSKLECKFDC